MGDDTVDRVVIGDGEHALAALLLGAAPSSRAEPPELRADLTAPTYDVTDRGIRIEGKDDIRARLGRSPGKGDAAMPAIANARARSFRRSGREKPWSWSWPPG